MIRSIQVQYGPNEYFINCFNCGKLITLTMRTCDELRSLGLKPKCLKCLGVKV